MLEMDHFSIKHFFVRISFRFCKDAVMRTNSRSSKLQNVTAGYYGNLFLIKIVLWKNGPSPILKKLDFFRGIQGSVAPLIMERDENFTELLSFLTSRSTQLAMLN